MLHSIEGITEIVINEARTREMGPYQEQKAASLKVQLFITKMIARRNVCPPVLSLEGLNEAFVELKPDL